MEKFAYITHISNGKCAKSGLLAHNPNYTSVIIKIFFIIFPAYQNIGIEPKLIVLS